MVLHPSGQQAKPAPIGDAYTGTSSTIAAGLPIGADGGDAVARLERSALRSAGPQHARNAAALRGERLAAINWRGLCTRRSSAPSGVQCQDIGDTSVPPSAPGDR